MVAGLWFFVPGRLPGASAVRAARRVPGRRPLDHEPADRQRRLPHVHRRLLAGGLCPVRPDLRPVGLATRACFASSVKMPWRRTSSIRSWPAPSSRTCPTTPRLWYVAAGFGVYFAICTLFNRYLEKHELFCLTPRFDHHISSWSSRSPSSTHLLGLPEPVSGASPRVTLAAPPRESCRGS